MLSSMEDYDSTQEPTPETPVRYGPDAVLTTHFGSVSNRSAAVKLCTSKEQAYDLKEGSGQYRFMRGYNEVTNSEMYKYLRLGVSSQSVMAFKALGYMTPESLQESPEVSALLPDILAREDREYPLEFIDQCEREEVSALDCQMSLRRGITTRHLKGQLDTRQLIAMFNRYVPREGLSLPVNNQKNVVDYFVDGTIPMELQHGESLRPEHVVATVNYCLKEDEAFLNELNADIPLFRKFVTALKLDKKNGVGELRSLLAKYGPEVLELKNPYFCLIKINDEDGSSHRAGLRVAAYIEEAISEELGPYRLWGLKHKANTIFFRDRGISIADLEKMMLAGITIPEFRQYVIAEGLSPQSLIAAKEDGIASPLVGGSL
jgi:hypothetical protein